MSTFTTQKSQFGMQLSPLRYRFDLANQLSKWNELDKTISVITGFFSQDLIAQSLIALKAN